MEMLTVKFDNLREGGKNIIGRPYQDMRTPVGEQFYITQEEIGKMRFIFPSKTKVDGILSVLVNGERVIIKDNVSRLMTGTKEIHEAKPVIKEGDQFWVVMDCQKIEGPEPYYLQIQFMRN